VANIARESSEISREIAGVAQSVEIQPVEFLTVEFLTGKINPIFTCCQRC